jgi:hypothetical protein
VVVNRGRVVTACVVGGVVVVVVVDERRGSQILNCQNVGSIESNKVIRKLLIK